MKLAQLRALLAAVESGSVHGAARRLHRTQPAISAALRSLEDSLEVALFDRNPRGLIPTSSGRILAARAQAGLDRLAHCAAQAGLSTTATRRLCEQSSDAQLRALGALVEAGGFSTAGRTLGLSQPSIHRAMSELGRLIGVRLWSRTGRNIEPTREAQAIAVGVGLALSEFRLGQEELREAMGRLDGLLLVGALPTARVGWLPKCLTDTLKAHPEASVSIMDGPYEEQLNALRHGRIDLIMGALRNSPAPPADIEQQSIFDDTLSIVVRDDHPLARMSDGKRRRLTTRQMSSLYWLLPPTGTPARVCFQSFMQANGLPEPTAFIECNSFLTIRAVLLETDYAAVVPTILIPSDVIRPRLKTLGPPLHGSAQPVGWATRSGFRPTRLLANFLEIARTTAYR